MAPLLNDYSMQHHYLSDLSTPSPMFSTGWFHSKFDGNFSLLSPFICDMLATKKIDECEGCGNHSGKASSSSTANGLE
jgi:hypothetical protein